MLGMLQWGIRQSSETENYLTSIERVLEYAKLKPEKSKTSEATKDKLVFNRKTAKNMLNAILSNQKLKSNTEKDGKVDFKKFRFNYYENGPIILKGLDLKIRTGEKIGVVGRTGAGKSSLISALFRVNNGIDGIIEINGEEIGNIPLKQLRHSLSIIPQEPVIFSDTIRANLDPFSNHTDEELWNALRQVELIDYIKSTDAKLEYFLEERGQNFSVGQKQLVCLARALLKQNKILLIDEATANVDPRTDSLIQATIRREFKKCTVITIAHRLNTIIDSDRIVVMSNGTVLEADSPANLLSNDQSSFYQIVNQSKDAKKLMQFALKSNAIEEVKDDDNDCLTAF